MASSKKSAQDASDEGISVKIDIEDPGLEHSFICLPHVPIREPVYLNIYDMHVKYNAVMSPLGLGIYHSGIEFYGVGKYK